MSAQDRTYYDVLGVARDTPMSVIKAAYRALAKEYHPDSSSAAAAAPERFHELQDAYAVLSDEAARFAYDGALAELREHAIAAVEEQPVAAPFAERSAVQITLDRFQLFSAPLAAAFEEAVASGQSEEELLDFAQLLEAHFLQEYFGADEDVRAMAGLLLLQCRRRALAELNALVSATASMSRSERQARLAGFAGRHFADQPAFASWFGSRFQAQAARNAVQQPAAPRALPRRRRPLGATAKIFCWSCAVYAGLCLASAATG